MLCIDHRLLEKRCLPTTPQPQQQQETDFSIVSFRSDFMLASEEHSLKAHENQWCLPMLPPPASPHAYSLKSRFGKVTHYWGRSRNGQVQVKRRPRRNAPVVPWQTCISGYARSTMPGSSPTSDRLW